MKKIVLSMLLLLAFLFTACAPSEPGSQTSDPTTATTQTQQITEQTTEQTTAPTDLTPEEIYNAFLKKLCVRLNKIILDDTYLDGLSTELGMAGVAEMAYHGGVQLLDKYGYTMQDINGDEVVELIICAVDESEEACVGKEILCIFTVADSQMKLLIEGWSRNSYYLLDDATFYRNASSGASNTVFATYMVTQTNDVICTDCYFTDVDADGNALYLHNTTGQTDPAEGEAVEGGEAAFIGITDGYDSKIQSFNLIAFSSVEID